MARKERAQWEEWARRIVKRELGRSVCRHDDGSAPSMYDLRIGPADAPEVAIEVVGAVDPVRTATWNRGPARGPLQVAITGDWSVEHTPSARIRALEKRIEPLLRGLEDRGLLNVRADHVLKWQDAALWGELDSLEITAAFCYRMPGTGKVHLGMTGIGGVVDSAGGALPQWIGEFLRDPRQRDVLSKLERSGARDCHAFVPVSFAGAPWAVESYLGGHLDEIPAAAPDLPPPLTGVWVVYEHSGRGLRWDGDAWRRFEARGEGIDD